ncbi:MAG: efflux RND transporter periplasmic adaptor subunit [Balneolaceae bacterium]|nr:efflux RND transporter periplasmic adaptor subunit [Balneolaceae bacterium]
MNFLKERKYLYWGGGIAFLFIFWLAVGSESSESVAIYTSPTRGDFVVTVTTSGELRAKTSTTILGPQGLREFRIHQITIMDMIPEGTVVQKGDYIAELDRSELSNTLQDQELELEEERSAYEVAKLDSSSTLSQARENIRNAEYALEEAEIAVEQSKYESPAVQRQTQIDFERAKRGLTQAKKEYEIARKQAEANLREIEADLKQEQRQTEQIQRLAQQFTIRAPENGMVIYRRNRDGTKITEGSQISAWDPGVAELPDFSVMNSVTYVNEVDIQKVRTGQRADIGLDAMPEKQLSGVVTNVANIGEQRPNSDSKVFQVTIEVDESDSTLRPSMTTSNTIFVNSVPDVVYAPLETVHSDDSLNFVYKRDGLNIIKQQVIMGLTNENAVVLKEGVEVSDQLYLSTPDPNETTGITTNYLPEAIVQKYREENKNQEKMNDQSQQMDQNADQQEPLPGNGVPNREVEGER